jgi:N-acetylmuramoyl-L-alanine amidase
MAKIIALDDGHGLETAGKRTPDGYKENIFNHYTKEFLIDELEYNGFKIVDVSPTRKDNSLADRCNRANDGNADIFVAIHFNAYMDRWQDVASGVETYHFPSSSSGKKLATKVHNYLIQGTEQKDRGVKTANFYVLKYTSMPAILCECGFMDNKIEAELMKSTAFRKECSQEIAKGICSYFGVTYKQPTDTVKYIVQAGAFSSYSNAKKLKEELIADGYNAIIKEAD